MALVLLAGVGARPADAEPRPGRIGTHDARTGGLLSCKTCHQGHAPEHQLSSSSLLARTAVCTACHGGAAAAGSAFRAAAGATLAGESTLVPASDILGEFAKPSHHPLIATEVRPTDRRRRAVLPRRPEDLAALPSGEGVGCTDCHDPHARWAPRLAGASRSGRTLAGPDGEPVLESVFCFRCHGSSQVLLPEARGRDVESSFRLDAASAHPLELAPVVFDLPGLRREAVGDGRLSCSSCHGSDRATGPSGPHGSVYEPLLVARYVRTDGQVEGPQAYELCYRCHDRTSLLGADTRFPPHRSHVQERGASCHACHDAHGSAEYAHLMRFDAELVRPNAAGDVDYSAEPGGVLRGTCRLRCHGAEHAPATY